MPAWSRCGRRWAQSLFSSIYASLRSGLTSGLSSGLAAVLAVVLAPPLTFPLTFPLALPLALLLPGPGPAWADSTPPLRSYLCEGDPLIAELERGPMDDPSIPDPSAAPVPVGGWVVLRWRELSLQLPRTNNAGEASFSDGKWWWSLEDPTHPRFRLRQPQGDPREFACVEASLPQPPH